MNLQHLCSAPHVEVYFDTWNNWLYLEWEGDISLEAMRHACLAVAHCFAAHAYPRVLSNNAQITNVGWEVAPWLAQQFLPYLGLAGVQQLAWVYAPGMRARTMAEQVLNSLSGEVMVALFADVEDAVSWLQQTRPTHASGCQLLPKRQPASATFQQLVQTFAQNLHGAAPLVAA